MTTNVKEAKDLHDLLVERQIEGSVSEGRERSEINEAIHIGGGVGCFLINHSANSELRQGQRVFLPSLHLHYHGFLTTRQIQDRTSQMTQEKCLAMALHAGSENLIPTRVYCAMTTSERTGADVSHAAMVLCKNGATFSLSGTSLLPGNAHSDPPVGKDPSSGKLEWLQGNDHHENLGAVEIQVPDRGFEFGTIRYWARISTIFY
eukprot:CCRYP_018191-RA/>CCRYP_018191-RA protein AED:0.26 eAED:0.26 QI:0/0/0/1/0.33/0/4/0/204